MSCSELPTLVPHIDTLVIQAETSIQCDEDGVTEANSNVVLTLTTTIAMQARALVQVRMKLMTASTTSRNTDEKYDNCSSGDDT